MTFQERLRAIIERELIRLDSWSVSTGLTDEQLKVLESLSRIARHLGTSDDDEADRGPSRTPTELLEALREQKS